MIPSQDLWIQKLKKKFKFTKKIELNTHGSLEAILTLTKMTTKSEAGDGWGVMSGVPNNGFWNPARSLPSPQNMSQK